MNSHQDVYLAHLDALLDQLQSAVSAIESARAYARSEEKYPLFLDVARTSLGRINETTHLIEHDLVLLEKEYHASARQEILVRMGLKGQENP